MIKTFFAIYAFGILMVMAGYVSCMYEISPYAATALSVGVVSVGIVVTIIVTIFVTDQNDA